MKIAGAMTAALVAALVFGGSIGAWLMAGPAIALPTWLGGAPAPEPACGTIIDKTGQRLPRRCRAWTGKSDPRGTPTAQCRDGQYSWNEQPYAPETCAAHGGVKVFL